MWPRSLYKTGDIVFLRYAVLSAFGSSDDSFASSWVDVDVDVVFVFSSVVSVVAGVVAASEAVSVEVEVVVVVVVVVSGCSGWVSSVSCAVDSLAGKGASKSSLPAYSAAMNH